MTDEGSRKLSRLRKQEKGSLIGIIGNLCAKNLNSFAVTPNEVACYNYL